MFTSRVAAPLLHQCDCRSDDALWVATWRAGGASRWLRCSRNARWHSHISKSGRATYSRTHGKRPCPYQVWCTLWSRDWNLFLECIDRFLGLCIRSGCLRFWLVDILISRKPLIWLKSKNSWFWVSTIFFLFSSFLCYVGNTCTIYMNIFMYSCKILLCLHVQVVIHPLYCGCAIISATFL